MSAHPPPQHTCQGEAPQEVPLTTVRVQASSSVRPESAHAPAAQTRSVTVRERVPIVPHPPVNPPQAPQLPVVVAPHIDPAVTRVHG